MLKLIKNEFLQAYQLGERDFHEIDLQGLDLSGLDLSNINLSGAILAGTNLNATKLLNANLSKADLSSAAIARAQLQEADLSWAKLKNADLVGANLTKIKAPALNLSGALLIRAQLNEANLLGANLSNANLTASCLESANLECVNFSNANLTNTDLTGTNLSWSNFSDARLNWAILSWAVAEAADFDNANLTGAKLLAANLACANLNNANLTGADLYFTNLAGAFITADLSTIARIASSRISFDTFRRSEWNNQTLLKWHASGATILEIESFSSEIQKDIRNSSDRMRITFSKNTSNLEEFALITLIHYIKADDLRILSVKNEDNISQISLNTNSTEQCSELVDALNNKIWLDNPEDFFMPEKIKQIIPQTQDLFSLIPILNELHENLLKIELLLPTDANDETLKFKAKLESATNMMTKKRQSSMDERTRFSWSAVSLPAVEPKEIT